MKHEFQLSAFPNSNFEIEKSVLTGKLKLQKDNIQVEQSKEKGKPFLVPDETGEVIKVFPKISLPDFVPALEIDGKIIHIFEKLKWFQYLLGGIPILLLFWGGALGGAIGALGAITSFQMFRKEGTETTKYLKVIGIVLASFILYAILVSLLFGLIY